MPDRRCIACGGDVEAGFFTAQGLDYTFGPHGQSKLLFIVPGTTTHRNPFSAFRQGLAQEPVDRTHRVYGGRCSACGFLMMWALEDETRVP